jgi:DNA primase
MSDNISKIKDRLNIVDIISVYLKLQKAGSNFKANCPFHNEKTPSFFVSPERQIWHCFGCQKGGDIFSFIQEIEGVEFSEALKILAARAGVELEEFDSSIKNIKDKLYQICEAATKFFQKQLYYSKTGQKAFDYLKKRGLNDDIINKFRLGFAPNDWNALGNYIRNSGFSVKDIIDAGLVVKRNLNFKSPEFSSGIYDRFRSRIIFPIEDSNGRVVGFTGRIFERDEKEAKYINTPQTLIYDKSRILYGLNHSRTNIKINDKCLLVEGNMDMIMSYQAGVNNVVATSGTSLTSNHLSVLKRYTNNLDFCFDTDSAGALATKRGIGMALAQGFNVKVVAINDKECKDPAEYVKKYGNEWKNLVLSAKPVMEFYFEKAKENYNPESIESKKQVLKTIAPFFKRLNSKVEKMHWLYQLAFLLRVKEEAIESDLISMEDDLSNYGFIDSPQSKGIKKNAIVDRLEAPDILNEAFLSIIIKKPILFKEEITSLDKKFLNLLSLKVLEELSKEDLEKFNFADFITKFDSDQKLSLEFIYLKSQMWWENFSDEELKIEFKNIFNKLKQKTIRQNLVDLEYQIRAAEITGDKNQVSVLALKFNELTKELAETHKI